MKVNIQKQPHQLSASVILAGGLTIYKEHIIQRTLSQRLPHQQGLPTGGALRGLSDDDRPHPEAFDHH